MNDRNFIYVVSAEHVLSDKSRVKTKIAFSTLDDAVTAARENLRDHAEWVLVEQVRIS